MVYSHTHVHTMEYYSAIKKNEVMPFAATWVDLEITILSEVSKKRTDIICHAKHIKRKLKWSCSYQIKHISKQKCVTMDKRSDFLIIKWSVHKRI